MQIIKKRYIIFKHKEEIYGYDVKDKKTGKTVIIAETKHCFTDKNLKPINLKKYAPEFSNKYESLLEK